ncbi:hypothetical protein G7Y89_g1024 [Cudoniella acicularis]|uniref:Uncharacterized protein n=1 Tax=Cudoniella acicularis TaxID=354080 RepID=A0A8H4WAN8_9HELO|nr:hypothetical protein G7Y89_g1024 [Cudoniella acicularis]
MSRSNLLTFSALALAAPKPQDIDFSLVDAAPDADPAAPLTDVTVDTITIIPSTAMVTVVAAVVTDVASAQKRDFWESLTILILTLNSPDDSDTSFLNYAPFKVASSAAATQSGIPQGYSLAFSNLQASSQTVSYLSLKILSKYDPIVCASYCDQLDGCVALNLYFERDPSLNPNATSCANPKSLTNIKCVRWGVQITPDTAINDGQWGDNFHVVIAGSNGYNKNAAPCSQPGFTGPVELGGAINATNDSATNTNTYMGYKFFSFSQIQTYDNGVSACTAAYTSQTGYNSRHPPAKGNPAVCNQVVVYVLSNNNQPQGNYCSMYSEA